MNWFVSKDNRNDKNFRLIAWFFSLVFHGGVLLLVIGYATGMRTTQCRERTSVIVAATFKPAHVNAPTNAPMHEHAAQPAVIHKRALWKKVVSAPVETSDSFSGNTAQNGDASEQGLAINFRQRPTLIDNADVKIPYPEQARRLMIEGIVKMRLTVSESGDVINAQVLSGPYHGLRNAALVVARQLSFLPATDEYGRARTADVDHEVVFRLNKRS